MTRGDKLGGPVASVARGSVRAWERQVSLCSVYLQSDLKEANMLTVELLWGQGKREGDIVCLCNVFLFSWSRVPLAFLWPRHMFASIRYFEAAQCQSRCHKNLMAPNLHTGIFVCEKLRPQRRLWGQRPLLWAIRGITRKRGKGERKKEKQRQK